MPPRAHLAYAVSAAGLVALALAEVLVVAVGGPLTGLGWARLLEDLVLTNALLGLMLTVPGFLLGRHRPGNAIGWLGCGCGCNAGWTGRSTAPGPTRRGRWPRSASG